MGLALAVLLLGILIVSAWLRYGHAYADTAPATQAATTPATTQAAAPPLTGTDIINPLNTVYTYDVTSFVAVQLTNPSPTALQTGMMLSVPPPANVGAFNRLIIADQSYPINQRITRIPSSKSSDNNHSWAGKFRLGRGDQR